MQEVDLDDPGPTEVLVEMFATGLCHSDEHYPANDMTLPTVPFVGGHEGWESCTRWGPRDRSGRR